MAVKNAKPPDELFRAVVASSGLSEAALRKPASIKLIYETQCDLVMQMLIQLRERDAVIEGLRARVEALEAGGIRYLGAYQRAQAYTRGDVVTHGGSMWTALREVPEGSVPGHNQAYWQLSAKDGKPVKRMPARTRPS